ncbi:MAG TPA: DUF4404 family protein [Steroidobacteraceae bacterium]|jgi:hypothetical protein
MADPTLQELLERVRAHLGAGPVEGDARQQLGALMRDLEHKLGQGAPASAAPATPRLESLAVKFEASHPALAETLREVIDALGKAGL